MCTERKLGDEINTVIEDVKDRTTKMPRSCTPLQLRTSSSRGATKCSGLCKIATIYLGTKVAKKPYGVT